MILMSSQVPGAWAGTQLDETPNLPLEKLALRAPKSMLGRGFLCSHMSPPLRPNSRASHVLWSSFRLDPGHTPFLFLTRSFAKPPKQVQTVCECILIMKGYKELNWKTAKGMMSDPNFLRSLMEMDFDSVTQSQVKNIRSEYRQCSHGRGHC